MSSRDDEVLALRRLVQAQKTEIAQLRQRIAVLEASARGGAEPRSPTEAASSPSTGLQRTRSSKGDISTASTAAKSPEQKVVRNGSATNHSKNSPRLASRSSSFVSRSTATDVVTSPSEKPESKLPQNPLWSSHHNAKTIVLHGRQSTVFPPPGLPAVLPEAPEATLELDHVYGFSTLCPGNLLHFLPSGKLAYAVGKMVVLLSLEAGRQEFYTQHSHEIRCQVIDDEHSETVIHIWSAKAPFLTQRVIIMPAETEISHIAFPEKHLSLLATVNARTPVVLKIWDWEEGLCVGRLALDNDLVSSLSFSPITGKLVAAGRSHLSFITLTASDTEANQLLLDRKQGLFQSRPKPKAILAVAYHPDGRTLTGDSNGDILLWSFPAPTYTIVQAVSAAHAGGVGLLNFTADGFISAGVHDNSVMLYGWDLKPFPIEEPETNKFHFPVSCQLLTCVQTAEGPSLVQFVVGLSNGRAVLCDAASGRQSVLIENCSEVAAVASDQQEPHRMYTAHGDGFVSAYDTTVFRLQWQTSVCHQVEMSPTCLAASPASLLAVGSQQGFLTILTCKDGTVRQQMLINEGISCLQYDPTGSKLACGGQDGILTLLDAVNNHVTLRKVQLGDIPLRHIDWSMDGHLVQITTAADTTYLQAADFKVAQNDAAANAAWMRHSSPISWSTQAIWRGLANSGIRLKTIDVTAQQGLLVAGDSKGVINLYRFPTHEVAAGYWPYRLHTSAVTALSFSSCGRWLLSSAENENALLQWKVCGISDAVAVPDSSEARRKRTAVPTLV